MFSVAGAGESHGPGVTTIVMGCPAGFGISRSAIQSDLDRRRPGGNKHGTPRNEKDQVAILSGLYQADHDALLGGGQIRFAVDGQSFETETYGTGTTTGEPIAAVVLSTSKKSKDYTQLQGDRGEVRPGHTDLVKHHQSQGFVDVRGGGRSSYRSTISDVIGGSIAKAILNQRFGFRVLSSIVSVGKLTAENTLAEKIEQLWRDADTHQIDEESIDRVDQQILASEIPSLDQHFASAAAELIKQTRKRGDSLGAVVEIVAVSVPPLVGSPLYQSLKLRLMATLGGLNAVQGCEIGDGFSVTGRTGSENNDPIRSDGYQSNTHGGLIGGITTGKPIVARVAFKPTSTIHLPQKSVDKGMRDIDFELTSGRHDPCVGVRAGVTLESRLAIEVLNATMVQSGKWLPPSWPKLFDGNDAARES